MRPALLALLSLFCSTAWADTVYLEDGRAWKGLIVGENDSELRLDLGFDVARLQKGKVLRVERSGAGESQTLRRDLEARRLRSQKTLSSRDGRPVEVPLINRDGHIFVEAVLDGRVKALLLLDTGSSVTFLTADTARALGISKQTPHEMVEVITADGRYEALGTVLQSIRVGEAEVTLMPVALLQAKIDEPLIGGGMLGVSFLSHFNFKIDYRRSKLILEKI